MGAACSQPQPPATRVKPKVAPAPTEPPAAAVTRTEPVKVRTGVASIEDLPGENDGCDRCFGKGCDEEKCCPDFWQDEGVPPVPVLSWVFSRQNKYLNDNDYVEVIGNCGIKEADKERKVLMGTALAFTVFSLCITAFGALSLSTKPSLTMLSAWAVGWDEWEGQGAVAYVGLSRLVMEKCATVPHGSHFTEWSGCEAVGYWWSDVAEMCSGAGAGVELGHAVYGFPCHALAVCAEEAGKNQFGALVTAVTLIFALIGCLTRIRKRADTNFQKIIGTFPDLIGVFSLGTALVTFATTCSVSMDDDDSEGYMWGPGFKAYVFCWVAAFVRFSMHALMPVPNAGIIAAEVDDLLLTGKTSSIKPAHTKQGGPSAERKNSLQKMHINSEMH